MSTSEGKERPSLLRAHWKTGLKIACAAVCAYVAVQIARRLMAGREERRRLVRALPRESDLVQRLPAPLAQNIPVRVPTRHVQHAMRAIREYADAQALDSALDRVEEEADEAEQTAATRERLQREIGDVVRRMGSPGEQKPAAADPEPAEGGKEEEKKVEEEEVEEEEKKVEEEVEEQRAPAPPPPSPEIPAPPRSPSPEPAEPEPPGDVVARFMSELAEKEEQGEEKPRNRRARERGEEGRARKRRAKTEEATPEP